MLAKIYHSPVSDQWRVVIYDGNTFLVSLHDTMDSAIRFCEEKGLRIEIW